VERPLVGRLSLSPWPPSPRFDLLRSPRHASDPASCRTTYHRASGFQELIARPGQTSQAAAVRRRKL